ncbi:MAG: hypothetical protein ACRYHA_24260 [Janthinobacterium lividum]
MTTLSRVICDDPWLRANLDHRGSAIPYRDVVQRILLTNNLIARADVTRLLAPEEDVRAAFLGTARGRVREMQAYLEKSGELPGDWNADRIEKSILHKIYRELYRKISDAWRDVCNVKIALAQQPQPDLPLAGRTRLSYLIRGDCQAMIAYLARNAPRFVQPTGARGATIMNAEWTTNQPLSTSVGDALAPLAGRSLVWLIRVDPPATKGRTGGLYSGEAEILFPHDVRFALRGTIVVGSESDIEHVDLTSFTFSEDLRHKMRCVYTRRENFLLRKKVCFLAANEIR